MISDTAFDLDLGADSPLRKDDPAQYWEAVRADLSTLIGELPIHKLILLGSQSGKGGERVVGCVDEVNRPKRHGRWIMVWQSCGAVVARRGMWHRFNACLPNSFQNNTLPKPRSVFFCGLA
jgi:hypothetical protein